MLTWRREVSYFAGSTFKSRDADRSRFLDILVSKPSKGGRTKPAREGRSQLQSMSKRELHSEANRWLASSPSNNEAIPASIRTQSNTRPSRKKTGRKKTIISNGMMGSMSSSDLDAHADRYLSSGSKSWGNGISNSPKRELHTESLSANENWGNWEPSSQMKRTGKRPMIKSNIHTNERIDRRQVMDTTQRVNRGESSHNDSRQTFDQRTGFVTKKRIKSKGQQSTSHSIDGSKLRGEPPPDNMDSTLFYPVGSSVRHKIHGSGIVQTPPIADAEFSEKMLVRVKFTDGNMEWDLPMDCLAHTYE